MKSFYLTTFTFLVLTSSSLAQKHFKQGFFEFDADFTKRIGREFEPKIYNGMITLIRYNDLSPMTLASHQPPVKTIQIISGRVKIKTFTSDGDVEPGIVSKELIGRLIGENNFVFSSSIEKYDIVNLKYLNEEEIRFSFEVNWELSKILFFEVRLEDVLLFRSTAFRLSDMIGAEGPYFQFY